MLMFYAKVIRQRNAVLEHIGHQFGYRPQAGLVARVGHGGEDDYAAFMVNVMTCIAHSGSFKEALENGVRMGMREPAFFCIVGALASTPVGVPKPWAHEISPFHPAPSPPTISRSCCGAKPGWAADRSTWIPLPNRRSVHRSSAR